jgi:hypothetical protein
VPGKHKILIAKHQQFRRSKHAVIILRLFYFLSIFFTLIADCQLIIKAINIMKKHLSVSVILSAVCLISPQSLSQDCSYSWSPQNSGTTRILYTCKAVSELVCWAAGANATVLRTTDGGDNWINANPNTGVIIGDVRNMEAIDANTAWVTTESQMSTAVYKTTDGGDSWFQVYSNNEGFIKGIRMLDALNGIAIESRIKPMECFINNRWREHMAAISEPP